MQLDIDGVLSALADHTRRDLFERIVARPSRSADLAQAVNLTQAAVLYHIRVLKDASLIEEHDGRYRAVVEQLPKIRIYFERLWLEAALGDTWLMDRRAKNSDLGF